MDPAGSGRRGHFSVDRLHIFPGAAGLPRPSGGPGHRRNAPARSRACTGNKFCRFTQGGHDMREARHRGARPGPRCPRPEGARASAAHRSARLWVQRTGAAPGSPPGRGGSGLPGAGSKVRERAGSQPRPSPLPPATARSSPGTSRGSVLLLAFPPAAVRDLRQR